MLDAVRARDLEPSGLNDDNGEHQTTDDHYYHSRDHGRGRHVYFSLAASAASLRSSIVSKLICSQMFSGIADSRYAIVLYSVTTASAVASPPSRRRRRPRHPPPRRLTSTCSTASRSVTLDLHPSAAPRCSLEDWRSLEAASGFDELT